MKAPSIFVSILFAAVAAVAVYLGGAASIVDALQSIVFHFVAAVSFVTSAWRLWQEYVTRAIKSCEESTGLWLAMICLVCFSTRAIESCEESFRSGWTSTSSIVSVLALSSRVRNRSP